MFNSEADIQSLKAEQRIRARKALQGVAQKDQKSFIIAEKIRSFIYSQFEANPTKHQFICATFMGLPSEPDLRDLITHPEIQPEMSSTFWALPRIAGSDLKFYVCDPELSISECLEKNSFGIEEPLPEKSKEVTAAQIDIVFMPGLAFDKKMSRLGRGKAYYDRFLQNFTGIKVGVLFHEQILNEDIVVQPHDIKMDWLITENYTYKTIEKKRTA